MAAVCPNPECPYQKRHHQAAEYRDGIETCSDCGSALVSTAPVVAVPQAPEPVPSAPPASPELIWRVLATAVVFLAVAAAGSLPLPALAPGLATVERSGLFTTAPKLLTFGLVPFTEAFAIVELIALVAFPRMRVGSPADRSRLRWAGILLALCFIVVQGWGMVQYVLSLAASDRVPSGAVDPSWLESPGALFAVLAAGAIGLHLLTVMIDRWGVGSGYAVVLVALSASEGIRKSLSAFERAVDVQAPVVGVAISAVLVAGTWFLLRDHERGGHPEKTAPRALRLPASGIDLVVFAGAAMSLPATLVHFSLLPRPALDWLYAERWRYWAIFTALAANLCIAFTLLFNRPGYVGRVWAAYSADAQSRDGVRTRAASRVLELLPRAGGLSLLAILVLAVAPWVLRSSGIPWLFGAELVFAVAAAMDLRAELQALRQGPLVPVWSLHRVYELEPALRALDSEGIRAFARGAYVRSLLQIFGPYVGIDVMVPPEKAEAARAIFERAREN